MHKYQIPNVHLKFDFSQYVQRISWKEGIVGVTRMGANGPTTSPGVQNLDGRKTACCYVIIIITCFSFFKVLVLIILFVLFTTIIISLLQYKYEYYYSDINHY